MQQLISPVLPGKGEVGYCIRYVRERFGIPSKYDPAWQGWENAEFKHFDRNFPDVAVPVWFKYKLPNSSPGHVVIRTPDGKFYSSPYNKSQPGYVIFNSVEEIERTLQAGYAGWSEDINGVRVAQGESMDRASAEIAVDSIDLGMGTGQEKYGWKRDPQSREYWVTRIMEHPSAVAEFAQACYKSKENEGLRYRANNTDGGYPALVKQVEQLKQSTGNFKKLNQDVYVKE